MRISVPLASTPVISETERRPSSITREILESYLVCKTKTFLKLNGERGLKSDYEVLSTETRAKVRNRADEKLASKHKHEEVIRGARITEEVLRRGAAFILDAIIEFDDLFLCCDALKRVKGVSRLGEHHYAPILVYEGKKGREEQRRVLEVFGLALGEAQGRYPEFGYIVHGSNSEMTRVSLLTRDARARALLVEIRKLRDKGAPPALTLNRHCAICEFRDGCQGQAEREDNISLLRGMGQKEISRLRSRGITTVAQLSYTFRASKKVRGVKANGLPHSFALQALALREDRVFILGESELPDSPVRIYFDCEGDPERGLIYLIGALIDDGVTEQRYSFWADSRDQEGQIVGRFLETVGRHEAARLFCYGSYEIAFLKRMRGSGRETEIDQVLARTTNILSVIYPSIYFPVYQNGLKEIARRLGFQWSDGNASGIQSIVWRQRWEETGDEEMKGRIEIYNLEDCAALKVVVQFIDALKRGEGAAGNQQRTGGAALECSRVQAVAATSKRREWCKAVFSVSDFDYINRLSYFDYQRERVYIRSSPVLRKARPKVRRGRGRKPAVEVRFEIKSERCPRCHGTDLRELCDRQLARLVMDLKVTSRGIRRRWLEVASYRYYCYGCHQSFVPSDYFRVDRHTHSVKAWAMYEHVAHRASFHTLEESFRDCFGLKIHGPHIHLFKSYLADYYRETYELLIEGIVSGKLIHADETQVKVKGVGKAYVWVFTNLEDVVYVYRSSREGGFLHEFLDGFRGVLVSDFYSAYDSLPCERQKCLIHLIRDFNHDIVGNPFDEDLKSLATEFGALLRRIVTTIDKHGLRHRHLRTHVKDADEFFESTLSRAYQSQVAQAYQERLEKYRHKLFTFLAHDGVPWNNNDAEHAIKKFAYYREIADSIYTEDSLKNHLILLSIHQTCVRRGISFFRFLLSRERDVGKFRARKSHTIHSVPYDLMPEGFVPPRREA